MAEVLGAAKMDKLKAERLMPARQLVKLKKQCALMTIEVKKIDNVFVFFKT